MCINFSLGLRVGELVAVRESCFLNDNLIRISQEEVKKYYLDTSGQIHREGYEIVNHTKTLQGVRELVVTEQTRKWFDMVREYNIQNGLKDEDFLFLDKKGNRIHDHAINNVIRRLNGVRNEKDAFVITDRPSGNHSIRKTCISELHESKLFSDDTIKTFAGHKDISTTQKCYIFETHNITAYADNFQKVFDN